MNCRTRLRASACLLFLLRPDGVPAQKAANPLAVIETNVGNITIELFKDQAPGTVANFIGYARAGFYAGTIFHRVVRDFVIQGGGFTPQMRQKPTRPPIKNEASILLKNDRGTVAAARTGGVDTATSQFFINTHQNVALDHKSIRPDEFGYAVFARVVEGMDVVETIEKVKTNSNDVPQSLIMILRVTIQEPQ